MINVIVDGRMLEVPTEDLKSESKARWWLNKDIMGDSQALHMKAQLGWHLYQDYSKPKPVIIKPLPWYMKVYNYIRSFI